MKSGNQEACRGLPCSLPCSLPHAHQNAPPLHHAICIHSHFLYSNDDDFKLRQASCETATEQLYCISPPNHSAYVHKMSNRSFTDLPAGYPTVAALAGRDKAFAIFRKFRSLNSRNLLYLQSELMTLERQLEVIDTELATGDLAALLSWPAFAEKDARKRLFDDIRAKLSRYSSITWYSMEKIQAYIPRCR